MPFPLLFHCTYFIKYIVFMFVKWKKNTKNTQPSNVSRSVVSVTVLRMPDRLSVVFICISGVQSITPFDPTCKVAKRLPGRVLFFKSLGGTVPLGC